MNNSIYGRWRWNDVVYCKGQAPHKDYDIAFKCNAEAFRAIFLDWSVGYHSLTYIDVNSNYVLAGKSQNEGDDFYSVDEAYRIMDFGETDQVIDDELYNFISANAEPYQGPLTIAEKLAVIAENEQRVYDKGYQVGNNVGLDVGLEVGYEDGFGKGKAEGYQEGLVSGEGYEKGKQAEYDEFWDAFQTSQRTDWAYAFTGESWNDITFRPKYDLVLSGSSKQAFMNCKITDLEKILEECGVTLDTSGATALNQLFQGSTITAIPTIDCTSCSAGGVSYMFNKCTFLKTIRNLIVDTSANPPSNPFTGCSALEYIRFEGDINWALKLGDSPKLTRESIENIIGHLYSGASNKTLTLSETAVNAAFGDEWDSYVTAHKPSGWNITLA
jgi:hypothetical protein